MTTENDNLHNSQLEAGEGGELITVEDGGGDAETGQIEKQGLFVRTQNEVSPS